MDHFRLLVQRIDGEAAEELGEKVGGLLGHYVAGEGYFPKLLHGNRVGEKGDVGFAAADLVNGFGGVAEIAEVGLLADLLGVEAEEAVENDGVKMTQVELALALGQVGKGGGDGLRFGTQQERAGAGDGDKGCTLLPAQRGHVTG